MSVSEHRLPQLREFLKELAPPWWARSRAEFHFPIDVQEKENEYIVYAAVPGLDPQQVSIEAEGTSLRISGEIPEERPEEPGEWLLRERPSGYFERTVTFPVNLATERA